MRIDIRFIKPAPADISSTATLPSPVITFSLTNHMGLDGKSAYEIAVANGFEGSEQEWLDSLGSSSAEAETIAKQAAAAAKDAMQTATTALSTSQEATQSAASALSTAQNAENSAKTATTAAQNAVATGEAATTAANEAKQTAATALSASQEATQSAASALSTAQNAENSVEAIASTATQASQKAEAALSAAQNAAEDAAAASVEAQNAGQTASAASAAATEALQKTSDAASSAEAALSAAQSASQDAQSALAAASAAADAATESQEQATAAVAAATAAGETANGLEAEIERVYTTLHEEIENIGSGSGGTGSPKNSGTAMTGGYYSSVSPLSLSGDISTELLFTTGDDVTSSQNVMTLGSNESLVVAGGKISFAFSSGVSAELCNQALPNSTYHFVLTCASGTKTIETFLNGGAQDKRNVTTWTNVISGIRLGKGSSFKGIIHHCRLFTAKLSDEVVEALWNAGRPDLYILPESLRGDNGGVCKAEFLPEGVADGYWTDTSTSAYKFKRNGTLAITQVAPQALGTAELSTGLITDAGAVEDTLAIPAGYRIDRLVFTSYNESAMSAVAITNSGDSSVIFEKDSFAAGASYLCDPSASGSIYVRGGSSLVLTAGGNTSKGCRLDTRIVWFRLR